MVMVRLIVMILVTIMAICCTLVVIPLSRTVATVFVLLISATAPFNIDRLSTMVWLILLVLMVVIASFLVRIAILMELTTASVVVVVRSVLLYISTTRTSIVWVPSIVVIIWWLMVVAIPALVEWRIVLAWLRPTTLMISWVGLRSTIRSLKICILLPWLIVRLGLRWVICASCSASWCTIELIRITLTLAVWWHTPIELLCEAGTATPCVIVVHPSTTVSTMARILGSLRDVRVLSSWILTVLSWALSIVNVFRGWLLLRSRGSRARFFVWLLNRLLFHTLTWGWGFFTGSVTTLGLTQVIPRCLLLSKHLLNDRGHINLLVRVTSLLTPWSLLLMLLTVLLFSLLVTRLVVGVLLILSWFTLVFPSCILLLAELLLMLLSRLWVRGLVSTIHERFVIIGQLISWIIVILLLLTLCFVIKLISKLLLDSALLLRVLILLPTGRRRLLILLALLLILLSLCSRLPRRLLLVYAWARFFTLFLTIVELGLLLLLLVACGSRWLNRLSLLIFKHGRILFLDRRCATRLLIELRLLIIVVCLEFLIKLVIFNIVFLMEIVTVAVIIVLLL